MRIMLNKYQPADKKNKKTVDILPANLVITSKRDLAAEFKAVDRS